MNRNENLKTLWFVGAAAVVVAVAWLSSSTRGNKDQVTVLGTKLFPDFKEPGDVDSLQVLRYDRASGKSLALEVAKQNGLWVIPSHSKYPADAKDHLAAAANSLIGLTILGLAPGFDKGSSLLEQGQSLTLREVHNSFGVVDPNPENVKPSDLGVGTRVTMKDAAGHELASAIIGKPVPDQPEQYYVRKANQDTVYIVKLDAGKLSVQFDEWIEPNLLNLNTLDLKKVEIKDYSVNVEPVKVDNHVELERVPTFKGEFTLVAPSGDQPWKLEQEVGFDAATDKRIPRPLAADEELNVTNLDELKRALEDLKIVDVERKPAAVPADLRVRKLDEATVETLGRRGFFLAPVSKDPEVPLEILSNSGDITLQMADGARYILRFGATKGESLAAEKAKKKVDAKSEKEDQAKDDSSPGMDRYLFVTADFNQGAIPPPVKEKLPEEKPAEKAPLNPAPTATGTPTPTAKAGEKPAEKAPGKKPDEKKAPDAKAEGKEAKPAERDKKGDAKNDESKKEPVKTEEGKKDAPVKDEAKKDEPKKDEAIKGEAKKDEVKKDEPKKDAPAKDEAKKDEPKKDEAKKDIAKEATSPEALAAQRKEIETKNKRAQEEYDDKVKAGKKHAKELADRFAQWYYVIPGQTYAKIHLNRQDIVKKKEPPKDKDAAGHDHEHDGAGSLPASPAGTLEQLKKDAPAVPEKK